MTTGTVTVSVGGTATSIARSVATAASQLFIVFGGAIPYIPQYVEIVSTNDAQGFSLYVCMAIVLANLLRISYWFGKYYDQALFIQSIVMIVVMFVMLELCLRTERKAGRVKNEHYFLEFQPSYFWKWTDLLSYVQAMVFIFIFFTFIVVFFRQYPMVTDVVGYMALVIEACLALPQFLNNYWNQSTYGMNKAMVCMWGMGDVFKLAYFIIRGVPFPFLVCVCFQFTLDIAILAQIFIYGDKPPTAEL